MEASLRNWRQWRQSSESGDHEGNPQKLDTMIQDPYHIVAHFATEIEYLRCFHIVYKKISMPRNPRNLIWRSCNPQNANLSSSVLSYRACSDAKSFRDKENSSSGTLERKYDVSVTLGTLEWGPTLSPIEVVQMKNYFGTKKFQVLGPLDPNLTS